MEALPVLHLWGARLRAIPFLPEFHDKVRDGRKTATARSKPYGKAGDRLQGPGVVLVLDSVEEKMLMEIAGDFYREEGLESPGEFVAIWNRIHPRAGYSPNRYVWFHRFHAEPQAIEEGASRAD